MGAFAGCTLEKLSAMQAGTQNKVTLEQGAGFAEEVQDVGHKKGWQELAQKEIPPIYSVLGRLSGAFVGCGVDK
jgi:hypothetical protein